MKAVLRFQSPVIVAFLLIQSILMTGVCEFHAIPQQSTADTLRTPERIDVIGGDTELYRIRDAVVYDDKIVVVQDPEPGVVVFQNGTVADEWGREGQGPAELKSPAEVAINDDQIAVLDGMLGKVVYYSHDGTPMHNTSIDDYAFTSSWAIAGSDTLISGDDMSFGGEPSDARTTPSTLIRLQDGETTPALDVDKPAGSLRIEPSQGPSMTMPAPFWARAWTMTEPGTVHWWKHDGYIVASGTDGTEQQRYSTDELRPFAVEDTDIDHFLTRRFNPDEEFGGVKDAFKHVREEARETVDFPEVFPAVLDMHAAPDGGLWLKRADKPAGAVWSYWREGEEHVYYQFPEDRDVLHFTDDYRVLMRGTTDEGVPVVEVYAVPVDA